MYSVSPDGTEVHTPPQGQSPARERLSPMEQRYLAAVVAAPGRGATFYTRELRLNGQRGQEVRELLKTAGFIRETPVAMEARGRVTYVLEPTEAGIEALEGATR